MMLGDVGSAPSVMRPALIVYAPLSITRVFDGGAGPEDFVRRWEGAIEVLWREKSCGVEGSAGHNRAGYLAEG